MKAAMLLFDLLDRLLQILVPPVANRIAYVSFPDYTDNAFYVFHHALRTRNDLEHVWLVRDRALHDRIAREFAETVRAAGTHGNVLRVENRRSLRGYFRFLRSRYVFHTYSAYRFRSWAWRRHVVSLWHGMPIKCVGRLNRITPNPYPTFGTMHLATSSFFRDIIATAFGVPQENVRTCSLPRCDALQFVESVQTSRSQIRERLGIPDGRKLVLWMPTYRAEGERSRGSRPRSFLDDVPEGALAALEQTADRTGCTIVTKLHALDQLDPATLRWDWRHIRLLSAQGWNALGIQLYDLLAASDGLISDVSSVLIDYLVTGRPAAILGFDPATYTRNLIFPIERLIDTGRFDVLQNPASFEAFLRRIGQVPLPETATFLYEAFALPGSEQVLREVGVNASTAYGTTPTIQGTRGLR